MKRSRHTAFGGQEDDSDNDDYIDNPPQPAATGLGAPSQPTQPTQPTYGTLPQPTLGAYTAGNGWNNPRMPAPLPLFNFLPVPTVPLVQPPASRGPNALRLPRQRAPVPPSDAHTRVPANYVFPQQKEEVGQGLTSGRNRFVLRDGDLEPVLRAPLLIRRTRRDPAHQQNGTQYPAGSTVIPAGTSLTQICQAWPRHVWGEMLRVFLSEKWDARRIWELLPQNGRNNANNRPWNYIQAAMGREVDTMMQEETGVRRVPVRKPKTPSPDAEEGTEQVKDEGFDEGGFEESDLANGVDVFSLDLSKAAGFTVELLTELAARYRAVGVRTQLRLLRAQGVNATERRAVRHWIQRHQIWFRAVRDGFVQLSGEPLDTWNPVEILRRYWLTLHPRAAIESLESYTERSQRGAWLMYADHIEHLMNQVSDEYDELVGVGDERGIVEEGSVEPEGDGEAAGGDDGDALEE